MRLCSRTAQWACVLSASKRRAQLGLRKLPECRKEEMRLIEIRDFDLCACGGTHVAQTSQIGTILIRKTEKVKQGIRVEFVVVTELCEWREEITQR